MFMNSLNYHPFYTLTVAKMKSLNILYSYTCIYVHDQIKLPTILYTQSG